MYAVWRLSAFWRVRYRRFHCILLTTFHTSMTAILSTPETSIGEDSLPACPFCNKHGFKRLGNHLPHCCERNGRDYGPFLSKKTLHKEKANSCKSSFCPKCHKRFIRLDTHLRTSATCRHVPSSDKAFSTPCAPPAMEAGSCPAHTAAPPAQPLTEPPQPCPPPPAAPTIFSCYCSRPCPKAQGVSASNR